MNLTLKKQHGPFLFWNIILKMMEKFEVEEIMMVKWSNRGWGTWTSEIGLF